MPFTQIINSISLLSTEMLSYSRFKPDEMCSWYMIIFTPNLRKSFIIVNKRLTE